jgi:hypothetical protein
VQDENQVHPFVDYLALVAASLTALAFGGGCAGCLPFWQLLAGGRRTSQDEGKRKYRLYLIQTFSLLAYFV